MSQNTELSVDIETLNLLLHIVDTSPLTLAANPQDGGSIDSLLRATEPLRKLAELRERLQKVNESLSQGTLVTPDGEPIFPSDNPDSSY